MRGGGGWRRGEKGAGKEADDGTSKSSGSDSRLLLHLQCKHRFWSFSFVGEATPFGGAFSFWSFCKELLEEAKAPKSFPKLGLHFSSLPFERTKRELSHLIHTTYLSSQFTYTFAKSITVLFCNEEEAFSLERKEFIFRRETDSNQLFSE